MSGCVWDKLVNATVPNGGPCRDVWMDIRKNNQSADVPLCRTKEQYQALLQTLYVAIYDRLISTACSHCVPRCETLNYQTSVQTITKIPERFENPHGGHAVIFYPSATELRYVDTYEYGMTSYVSDVFGNLGFITGFSLITIFVGFEWLVKFSRTYLATRRNMRRGCQSDGSSMLINRKEHRENISNRTKLTPAIAWKE